MGIFSGATSGAAIGSVVPGVGTIAGGIVGAGKSILGGLSGAAKDAAYKLKMNSTWVSGAIKAVNAHRAAKTSENDWINLVVNKAPAGFRSYLPLTLYSPIDSLAPAGNTIPAYTDPSLPSKAYNVIGGSANSKFLLYAGIGIAVLLVVIAIAKR